MSRAWLWWVSLLLFFGALWSFLASHNLIYSTERLFWSAQISALRMVKDPASAPPAAVQKTLSRLQEVIRRYPASNLAARAQLLIGQVHAARKEYPAAHEAFQKVISDYPTLARHVIDAYRSDAGTCLMEKSWQKALEIYRKLLSKYPTELRVMDVPQLMAGVARNAPDAGESVLREAIQHYHLVIGQCKPGSTLYLVAQQRLAGCYLLASRWKEAAQIYETLVMTYFNRREVRYWMKAVEELGKRRLGDPSRAHTLALQFAEQHPNRRVLVEPWLK